MPTQLLIADLYQMAALQLPLSHASYKLNQWFQIAYGAFVGASKQEELVWYRVYTVLDLV